MMHKLDIVNLPCDSLDNSLVLLCGLIDSSDCDSSGLVTGVNHPSGELLSVPATMAAIIRLCLDIGQIVPSLILTKLLFYSNS